MQEVSTASSGRSHHRPKTTGDSLQLSLKRLKDTFSEAIEKNISQGGTQNVYKKYLERGDSEIADELLENFDNYRRHEWMNLVENLNFTHCSRQAWRFLRKLDGNSPMVKRASNIHPYDIAKRIASISKVPSNRHYSKEAAKQLLAFQNSAEDGTEFSFTFTMSEVETDLVEIKLDKTAR